MKKTVILFVLFVANTAFAQWTTGTNILYTTTPVVSIGATTIQGQYGNPPNASVLEIVSAQGSGSFINLKSGTKGLFLSVNSIYGLGINISANDTFGFAYGATNVMKINPITTDNPGGSLSIGTNLNPSGYKLAVGGKIIAEELKVQLQSAPWPDYVFRNDYKLPTLEEVEKQIQEKGHLINMPSATEVKENGFEVGEMTRIQQEKIEELTLYIIKLNEQLKTQEKRMQALEAKVNN